LSPEETEKLDKEAQASSKNFITVFGKPHGEYMDEKGILSFNQGKASTNAQVAAVCRVLETFGAGGAINAGGITAARTLAGGPDVWKGEKIALSSNKLGDKAGSYIANVLSTNTFLKVLHLDDNLLDAGSGEAIGRMLAANSVLSLLNVSRCRLGERGGAAVGVGLASNTALRTLFLNRCSLEDRAGTSIGKSLRMNSTLTALYLQENALGDLAALALAEGLNNNKTVVRVFLDNNKIKDAGGTAIGRMLRSNSSIAVLSLRSNMIGDRGGASIGEGLTLNATLKTFFLQFNRLGEEAGLSIGQALNTNVTIERLYLNDNQLGNSAGRMIAKALHSNPVQALMELDLRGNAFTYAVVQELVPACVSWAQVDIRRAVKLFRRASITGHTLDMGNSGIGGTEEQCFWLLGIFSTNRLLSKIVLRKNNITDAVGIEIAKCLEKNPSAVLREVLLDSNELGDDAAEALANAIDMTPALHGIKLNLYGHDFEPDTRQLLADIAADTGSTILFDDGY